MATQDQSGEQPIITGTHGGYYWLTDSDQYIGTLVRICADAVLGRYLAVTSIDSGSAWLTDRQQASKWQLRSGIAYSPRLADVEDLFYQRDGAESPGYDEWYVFDAPPTDLGEVIRENPFLEANAPRPGRLMVFVNYVGFSLHDSAWDSVSAMFWRQMEWIQPAAYIADGSDYLTFVCKDRQLFDSVCQRLTNALE